MAYRPTDPAPERRPSRFPRPGNGEEEAGPREMPGGGVSMRRPGASPWRGGFARPEAAPPEEEERRPPRGGGSWIEQMAEEMVPEEERRAAKVPFGELYTLLAPPAPRKRRFEEPEPPPRERPRPGVVPGVPPRRPARAREGEPVVDPTNWFNGKDAPTLPVIWDGIRQLKADARFRPGYPVAVTQIAPPTRDEMARAEELIRFFKFSPREVERYPGAEIWPGLLHPFLDELSYALNYMKPTDLPGEVGFQVGKDKSFWLGYMER